MPASSSRSVRVGLRFGGAWTPTSGSRTSRASATAWMKSSSPGGALRHPCSAVRREVLHDDFLHVAVFAMELPDREQGFHALARCFADADQNAGGERDRELTGLAQHAQPARGALVRRAMVRSASLAQPLAHVFEHQPEADVERRSRRMSS